MTGGIFEHYQYRGCQGGGEFKFEGSGEILTHAISSTGGFGFDDKIPEKKIV